jgi:hypothetical protein
MEAENLEEPVRFLGTLLSGWAYGYAYLARLLEDPVKTTSSSRFLPSEEAVRAIKDSPQKSADVAEFVQKYSHLVTNTAAEEPIDKASFQIRKACGILLASTTNKMYTSWFKSLSGDHQQSHLRGFSGYRAIQARHDAAMASSSKVEWKDAQSMLSLLYPASGNQLYQYESGDRVTNMECALLYQIFLHFFVSAEEIRHNVSGILLSHGLDTESKVVNLLTLLGSPHPVRELISWIDLLIF